jgi:hypothetical protein
VQQNLDSLASRECSLDAAVLDGNGGLSVGLLRRGCQSRGLVGTVDHCCYWREAISCSGAIAAQATVVELVSCCRRFVVVSWFGLGEVCSCSKDGP